MKGQTKGQTLHERKNESKILIAFKNAFREPADASFKRCESRLSGQNNDSAVIG